MLILLLNKSRTSMMKVLTTFAKHPLKAEPETIVVDGSGKESGLHIQLTGEDLIGTTLESKTSMKKLPLLVSKTL